MKKVEKKIISQYLDLIESGAKTYDFRLADFDIKPGDILVLKEWDPQKREFTGRSLERLVSYVGKTKGDDTWPQSEVDKYGYQIISLQSPAGEKND